MKLEDRREKPASLREHLLSLSYATKRSLQLLADCALVCLALWLAFVSRFENFTSVNPLGGHAPVFVLLPLLSLPIFVRFGLYRAVIRYMGSHALTSVFSAVSLSALCLGVMTWIVKPTTAVMPRLLPLSYWLFALLLLGGLRVVMRWYFNGLSPTTRSSLAEAEPTADAPRVAIYGAGSAGNQLLTALRIGREMNPVALIDDAPGLQGRVIDGLRVYSGEEIERMMAETGATEVLLAIPSATRSRRREILDMLGQFQVHVRTVPGFMDLACGRVKVSDFQEVDIADLLGREQVTPDERLFERCIREQVVMVTGAGGSIGSELCRQIATSRPRALILFEHSEYALYRIHCELSKCPQVLAQGIELIPILGSVRNFGRLFDVMRTWRVNTVYHAAAYKHVPMVEFNIAEGFFNNTMGTLHTAQAALAAGVANFVLISTDKAVRPTNVMGSTKRMAEMVLQALAREPEPALYRDLDGARRTNRTRFTMVRFGNVLGSSGSVIPLFREQIKNGGPVTVTHPDITRYFMTIPEAAQLVIQAGSMGEGGEVFVLDMGKPVKILDLAQKKIHLAGLSIRDEKNPNGDIEIVFSGLRPGEKLYEELLIGGDVLATTHPKIMRAQEEFISWEELTARFEHLIGAIKSDDYVTVRGALQELVSGYRPGERIVDLLHSARSTTTSGRFSDS